MLRQAKRNASHAEQRNKDDIMDIAKTKRRENIAEYILYLWQLEDLLRALQFSPEAVHSQLIAPRNLSQPEQRLYLEWYMDIADLLRQEGKERQGHLDHTLHLIADLHNLHLQLMKLPAGARYRELYARLEPELPRLRAVLGRNETSDTELCFRALYAAMLYRIRGEGGQQAVADTVEYISPAIAELASMYGKVERGEIDLFEREKNSRRLRRSGNCPVAWKKGLPLAATTPFFGLRTLKNGADATPRRRTARRATPATAIRAGRPPRRTARGCYAENRRRPTTVSLCSGVPDGRRRANRDGGCAWFSLPYPKPLRRW